MVRLRGPKPRRAAMLFFLVLLFSCRTAEPRLPEAPLLPPPAEEETQSLTLIAAGDNLFQEDLLRASREGDRYDFAPLYEGIAPLIREADLAFINQETVLGTEESGYSGYPRFNTPRDLGRVLADTGFDIIGHANNHIMDQGMEAVYGVMDLWDSLGVSYLGIHRSAGARETRQLIMERGGIRVGFLAYTYGTNGLPLPGDRPYLVSLIDEKTMAGEIDLLRSRCDFLVVSMHWGQEYAHIPSEEQCRLAAFLAEHLVDLIIGHHPHVLQPLEYLPRPDGKTTLCAYSLGNLISAHQLNPKPTVLGGLLYVRLIKNRAGLSIEEAGIIPVVTHFERGFTGFRIYPLYQYGEDLIRRHGLAETGLTLEYFNTLLGNLYENGAILHNPFTAVDPRRGLSGAD